jgi:hypothetical protein
LETTRVQLIELVKRGAIYTVLGNLLISVWKKNRQERSLYMSRKDLADLGSPEVKSADMDSTLRTEKGRILPIGLSASFWSIRLVGALALALTDSCASGLADWMPTSAS